MKRPITLLFKSTIIVLLFSGAPLLHAQSLPNKQEKSVYAPAGIKIDGKPTEWVQFEAYNNANEFYYTLSNDNENLYLAVQATHHGIIQKIAAGGITLSIKSTAKNTVAPVEITYPIIPVPYDENISYKIRTTKKLSESQLADLNKQISGHIKEITVSGIAGIDNGSVPVYNDMGIVGNGLLDNQKAYTCEMALPLKYITQLIDSDGKFNYRLQVNGLDTSGKNGYVVVGGKGMNPSASSVTHDSIHFLTSPTYLDGTYTLAK